MDRVYAGLPVVAIEDLPVQPPLRQINGGGGPPRYPFMMCFSPEASFTTAGLTGLIGVVCLMRTTTAREIPLAATPLVFGAQQAIEGGLWLNLPIAPHGPAAGVLTLAFLFFALVFWPIYAPLATWWLEPKASRRRLMLVCVAAGAAVAAYLAWRVFAAPTDAIIANRCIVYRMPGGHPLWLGVAYMTATTVPLIVSSRRVLRALGVVILAGSAIAYVFYWQSFLSVWCFFAAAASTVILAHFELARRPALRLAAA